MEEVLMEYTKERQIALSKLLWRLLLGWRRWMALGIIFAIIVPGLLYMNDRSVYQKNIMNFKCNKMVRS